jgi:hypothetical protein
MFSIQKPNGKNMYKSALDVRKDLQKFAIENETIANLIFDREVDVAERKEWAKKLLVETIKEPDKQDSAWIIEKLMYNKVLPKTAANNHELFQQGDDDENVNDQYYVDLIEKSFTAEDIKRMSKTWWLKSIGRDLQWAGRPEMLLFALKFQMHVVILTHRENGTQVDGTHTTIHSMKSDLQVLVPIPDKGKVNTTILMWALNSSDPLTPMEEYEETTHYVTLSTLCNKHQLTKTKKANAFLFEKGADGKKTRKPK